MNACPSLTRKHPLPIQSAKLESLGNSIIDNWRADQGVTERKDLPKCRALAEVYSPYLLSVMDRKQKCSRAGMSNSQPTGHMCPWEASNAAPYNCKLLTLFDFNDIYIH